MTTNCLNSKIAEGGNLKPTIFTAILNLYERGLRTLTAQDVRVECENIDNTIPWGNRLAAICNTMKNAIECGGVIVCEDRNNNFKISFDGKFENLISTNVKPIHKLHKSDINSKNLSSKLVKSIGMPTNESFKIINEKLDWNKIQDKSQKKLLIIGCSDTKTPGGSNILQNNCFENPILYNDLLENRIERNTQYSTLIATEPNYFDKNRNGLGAVDATYFSERINTPLYLPAIERYAGGKFYSPNLISLYNYKNQQSNLHILIISGLYGIVEFRDSIIDYHLKIDKINFWTDKNNSSILETVQKYIQVNDITNNMVFYSLSDVYKNVLGPIIQWQDLWISRDGDRSANSINSAKYLENEFLPRL